MSLEDEVKETILKMLDPPRGEIYTQPSEASVRSYQGKIFVFHGENEHVYKLELIPVVPGASP